MWKLRNNLFFLVAIMGLLVGPGCRRAETVAPTDSEQLQDSDAPDDVFDAGVDGGAEKWDAPKNVVLFIGDGMGQNQIAAAGMYENGSSNTLYFEDFPVHGLVTNESADQEITDSAAASTAMACGKKVNNHVLALAIPGDGHALPSLLDFYKHEQKSTGLVTTTYITHATPAAFAAHAEDRYNYELIAWHYLNTGRPEIFFGGGGFGMLDDAVTAAGYTLIHSLDGFDPPAQGGSAMIAGLFGEGFYPYEASGVTDRPHLWETGTAAVQTLSTDPDGFFVMIEGGMIDQAAHVNRLDLVVGEMIAFERTVRDVVAQVNLEDTLIIVTADHATGDLQIQQNNGRGTLPDVTWGTTGHNAGAVDLFAMGKCADAFQQRFDRQQGKIDNTEIYDLLTQPAR